MSDSYKYDVFISYAREDGLKHAEQIEKCLQEAGFVVWRDMRNLNPTQDYTSKLEIAITQSKIVVVCITPDVERDDSFVRRELQYAINKKKPIIPVLLEKNAELPIHICTLTYIDFVKQKWELACQQLCQRIDDIKSGKFTEKGGITPPDDPFRAYCNLLYDQIVAFLNHTVFSMLPTQSPDTLITLVAKDTPNAVPEIAMQEASALPLQFFGMAGLEMEVNADSPKFNDFPGAFDHYDGRVLLLGEPGAGKTTTLFAFARDAVSRRLNDPSEPLPILLPAISWNAEERPLLLEWVTSAVPAFKSKRAEVETMINDGKALLMLDGLDELGDRRELYERDLNTNRKIFVGEYDPRPVFIEMIVGEDVLRHSDMSNKTIISCRIKDYQDIISKNSKVPLNGAVTLQPLDDAQLQIYLRDLPELWDALKNDDDLRDVARTPLLLSLFTYAFSGIVKEESSAEALEDLRTLKGGALRDKIFRTYIERRYKHEEAKYKHRGEKPPFTVQQIYEVLGHVAMVDACGMEDNLLLREYFKNGSIDLQSIERFIEFMRSLHLLTDGEIIKRTIPYKRLIMREEKSYRFIHLLLRDHLVFEYCVPRLSDNAGYEISFSFDPAGALSKIHDERSVETLITSLAYTDGISKVNIIEVLGELKDIHAVEPLIATLKDEDVEVRWSVADALGKIGDVRAVEALIPLLNDQSTVWIVRKVNEEVRIALEKIGTPEALQAIKEAEKKGWLD